MGRKVDWTLKPKKGPGRKSKKQPAPTFPGLDVTTSKSLKKQKPPRPVKSQKKTTRQERSDSDDELFPDVNASDGKSQRTGHRPAKVPKKDKAPLHTPESDDEDYLNDEFDPETILKGERSDEDDEEGSESGNELNNDESEEDGEEFGTTAPQGISDDEDELPFEKEAKVLLEKAKKRK